MNALEYASSSSRPRKALLENPFAGAKIQPQFMRSRSRYAPLMRQRVHPEQGRLWTGNRLGCSRFIDADRVARAVEFTRFPCSHAPEDEPYGREGRLVQGADLIGQLGDLLYLKKANALFYEFEEIGLNRQLGYASPADLVERFPDFYWTSVSPHIQDAVGYLNVTASGRQWLANLHSHVFCAEHSFALMGPQR